MGLRLAALAALLAACASVKPKRLVIPDDMRRPIASGPSVAQASPPSAPPDGSMERYTLAHDDPRRPKTPQPASAAAPAPKPAPVVAKAPTAESQRYTLRLVEHGRVWEVELPESTGGYEVRIPMGSPVDTPTAADQEMLGKTPPEGRSKSYLGTLAKVSEMYGAHRYELALIEIVDLEQQYPKDARLLAMKGSLYQKLGKPKLAREAWKQALEMDPSDVTVAEALRALKEE
jgi:tetratricopeptide (TPR) repeat protein